MALPDFLAAPSEQSLSRRSWYDCIQSHNKALSSHQSTQDITTSQAFRPFPGTAVPGDGEAPRLGPCYAAGRGDIGSLAGIGRLLGLAEKLGSPLSLPVLKGKPS